MIKLPVVCSGELLCFRPNNALAGLDDGCSMPEKEQEKRWKSSIQEPASSITGIIRNLASIQRLV